MKLEHLVLLILISLLSVNCIDPVNPEFEYKEGLVFVEGFASTAQGASFVTISKSANVFGVNKAVFEKGANVTFKNSDTGQIIGLSELGDFYLPPADFTVEVGERWELAVSLADGTRYSSTPETVLEPVPISNIKATYDPQLRFLEGSNDFEPGHAISVTFSDPQESENYYYWSFRSFENLTVCATCFDGILREGSCTTTTVPTPEYFTYTCETDCWRIRFPESISIFDDKFSNGNTTADLEVAQVMLYTKEDMVVELQQISLTPAAYEYYKVLKDIVDNSSGFNAPPPAALVGNITNANNSEDFVFGRFTAASTSIASIYIERSSINETPLERQESLIFEPTLNSPYPPPATVETPCTENRFRTAIRPEAWIQ